MRAMCRLVHSGAALRARSVWDCCGLEELGVMFRGRDNRWRLFDDRCPGIGAVCLGIALRCSLPLQYKVFYSNHSSASIEPGIYSCRQMFGL
jgi:hypothetical protein